MSYMFNIKSMVQAAAVEKGTKFVENSYLTVNNAFKTLSKFLRINCTFRWSELFQRLNILKRISFKLSSVKFAFVFFNS